MFNVPFQSAPVLAGFYEGVSNPATQMRLPNTATEADVQRVGNAMLMMLKQDSVAYHKPENTRDPNAPLALDIEMTRPITDAEISTLGGKLEGAALITTPEGLRIVDFGGKFDSDQAFKAAFAEAQEGVIPDGVVTRSGPFNFYGREITHDWAKDKSGSDLARRLAATESPDILRRFHAVLRDYAVTEARFAEANGLPTTDINSRIAAELERVIQQRESIAESASLPTQQTGLRQGLLGSIPPPLNSYLRERINTLVEAASNALAGSVPNDTVTGIGAFNFYGKEITHD